MCIMVISGIFMQRWTTILCNIVYIIIALSVQHSLGGVCWEYIDGATNLCRKAFSLNMAYEECCGIQGLASISYTSHGITSDIFYWSFLSIGAHTCQRCHKNCSSVTCEQGKACRLVEGLPVCVCKPRCDKTVKARGALCGTDGRKYRNYCALQRYNCATERQILVEYFGKCRKSCKRVECDEGRHCLQDQNGTPHCVPCNVHCNTVLPDSPAPYICGENGKTYRKNTCELKAAICKEGRSIRVAHVGKCLVNETCKTLKCPLHMKCLVSANGRPVCMNCASRCLQYESVTVCGNDRRTYSSYCHMIKMGCSTGRFISTQRRGPCKREQKGNGILKKGKKISRKRNEEKSRGTDSENKKKHKGEHHRHDSKHTRRKYRDRNRKLKHKKEQLKFKKNISQYQIVSLSDSRNTRRSGRLKKTDDISNTS